MAGSRSQALPRAKKPRGERAGELGERVLLGVHVDERGLALEREPADLHGQVGRAARPDDEQEVRRARGAERAVHPVVLLVVVLVEPEHVRPEPAAAAPGRGGARAPRPVNGSSFARGGNGGRSMSPAPHVVGAADVGGVAVDAEDALGAGAPVEPVDVLGDEREALAERALERRPAPRGRRSAARPGRCRSGRGTSARPPPARARTSRGWPSPAACSCASRPPSTPRVPRKVGIPLSAEMPAPVSATTRPRRAPDVLEDGLRASVPSGVLTWRPAGADHGPCWRVPAGPL